MDAIAVIGAGGYVGSSLVESLVLDGCTPVRAVVRAFRSMACLCRFGRAVTISVANAEDPASLVPAIEGCSVVVNLTTGAPAGIIRSTEAIHEACLAAKVRRLIHLSSAVVYGDVVSPSINDDSPPISRHWMPYATAKSASEMWLKKRMGTTSLEITVLRPGIVWGVRSPHTMNIVQALLHKRAFLVDEGKGIFNAIYVANLTACIRACWEHSSDVTGFFNVADEEVVTWREFYAALADYLDFEIARVPTVSGDRFPWSSSALSDYIQSLPVVNGLYHRLKSHIPDAVKSSLKSRLAGSYEYDRIASEYVTQPGVDREMWHLQKTKHKLPTTKFARHFRFAAPVSFQEGVRRTVDWLAFLGYVRNAEHRAS